VPGSVALPAGAVGNSTAYARADHSHPAQVLRADDLIDVSITGTPTDGQVLRYGSGGTFVNEKLSFSDLTGAPPAPTPSLFAGLAATPGGTVGNSSQYARADHTHPTPSLKADDLSDVTVTTPAAGQVLRYNGSAFVNAAIAYADITGTPPAGTTVNPSTTAGLADTAGGTVGVSNLYARADHTHPAPSLKADDLTDVTVAAPATGQVLRWSGAAFVNAAIAYGDITGTPTIAPPPLPSQIPGMAPTEQPTIGTSDEYARADHTHPSASSEPACNFYQASRTVTADDLGKLICNDSPAGIEVMFSLPDDTVFPVGTRLDFVDASATSATSLRAPPAGEIVYSSTLNNGGGAGTPVTVTGKVVLASPYFRVTAIKTRANRWILFT
jgi:hypothetical protein